MSMMILFATSCSDSDNYFMSGIAVKSRVKPAEQIALFPYETVSSDAFDVVRGVEAKIDSFLFIVSDDASTLYGFSWDKSKIYKYSLTH